MSRKRKRRRKRRKNDGIAKEREKDGRFCSTAPEEARIALLQQRGSRRRNEDITVRGNARLFPVSVARPEEASNEKETPLFAATSKSLIMRISSVAMKSLPLRLTSVYGCY
ncbi:hypothetical protein HN011_005131 [Eciton burchellii]|nr:hypothetical protein HN011_005131 [Eciton burchellii]